MTEENKSLQSPQNEPEPEAKPVDTAAAMQYFEASEAAAEVGREILASRKPKKQKQKKPKKKKSPVQQEPETAPASVTAVPTGRASIRENTPCWPTSASRS